MDARTASLARRENASQSSARTASLSPAGANRRPILGSMPSRIDGLDEAQREAVTHPGGPLLVVAGAGTGKTLTVTERFAWLVERGSAPDSILALTSSNGAADEMRARLEAVLKSPWEELAVWTF